MKIFTKTTTGIISSVQRYKIKWKVLKWVILIPMAMVCTHLYTNIMAIRNRMRYNILFPGMIIKTNNNGRRRTPEALYELR